ncbi:hypothetical protein Ct9H90mP29_11190 [bacterium]|nr:MAG: hypothetical protein Ct9H90mP29_11190 [bacterium]
MSRICDVTGKKPMFGNNVSHANNKSRRRFNINLQKKKFWLPDENRYITLRLSTRGMRVMIKRVSQGLLKILELKVLKFRGECLYTILFMPLGKTRGFLLEALNIL